MNTETVNTVALGDLPTVGALLAGGLYCGAITKPTGELCAVILLPDQPDTDVDWNEAKAWAASVGGELPTRPVAALMFAAVKPHLQPRWHWTADEDDASYAWGCYFLIGSQLYDDKSSEGRAVAVRMIPVTA